VKRVALAALLALAGCTPELCEVENLPFRGEPTDEQQLFTLAQHAAKNECTGTLYGLLSKRTRDEHSALKFSLFWESLDVPDPWGYRVVDVVAKGQYAGVLEDPLGRKLLYVQYQEPGKPDLLAQLYVVYEKDEKGRVVPRLALQDQVDAQETPHPIPVAQPPGPTDGVQLATNRAVAEDGGCTLARPGRSGGGAPLALVALLVGLAVRRRT
jgi:hypothetical protein